MAIGDGSHFEVVGEDEAGKADLVAQKGDDVGRKGGRARGVEFRKQNVCAHHGGHARARDRGEGRELDGT